MKSIPTALLAAGLAVAVPAFAQGGPSIAKVNGVAVSQQHLDLLVKNLVAQGRQDTPEMREQLKQQMINRELMTQDAVKRGLDKQAETSARLTFARQDVLSSAYVQEVLKAHPVNDEAMRKEYERIKTQLGAKEYKARHILVAKEDEAKDIIAQIKKGASFEKLAGERSIDTGTKANGGDLDWGPPARYVKPFADALVKLKKGQMTDAPVQTQHGWHVIRVDDERATRIPGFEEAKPQLQQLLQNQALEKAVADLRAKAKIE
jgi:peptidyl-prolyl cis-trans isomerase C